MRLAIIIIEIVNLDIFLSISSMLKILIKIHFNLQCELAKIDLVVKINK